MNTTSQPVNKVDVLKTMFPLKICDLVGRVAPRICAATVFMTPGPAATLQPSQAREFRKCHWYLVNIQKNMEHHDFLMGKPSINGQSSMVMLVYQRVNDVPSELLKQLGF